MVRGAAISTATGVWHALASASTAASAAVLEADIAPLRCGAITSVSRATRRARAAGLRTSDRRRRPMRPWLAIALLLSAVAPARAEEAPAAPAADAPKKDEWQFILAPYLWGTSIDGTLEADGISTDVDVSFSDIVDDLDIGALANFEARRNKLSITTDVIYMKVSSDGTRPVGSGIGPFPPGSLATSVDAQALIFEGRLAWEVLSLPLAGESDPRRLAVDVGPLFRVWWLDTDADAKLRPGFPGGPFSASFDESIDWVDFTLAARARAALTDDIGIVIAGDYGGFDIGSSSHRTWSIAGYFSYKLG